MTLKVDEIQNTSGGAVTLTNQSAAKAWCNQDFGTTINDSFNIASLTDNGAGDYTHNFSNSFANAGYSPTTLSFAGSYTSGGYSRQTGYDGSGDIAVGSLRTHHTTAAPASYDAPAQCIQCCGDLA